MSNTPKQTDGSSPPAAASAEPPAKPAHRFEENPDGTWTHTHSNGSQTYRRASSGTFYHAETPPEVVAVLESVWAQRGSDRRGPRVRVFYGDPATGRDWLEENDTRGLLGRSTGQLKVPLLLARKDSLGGGALLDHCIVRIQVDGVDRWRAGNYHQGDLELRPSGAEKHPFGVFRAEKSSETGERTSVNVANFATEELRAGWVQFIRGEALTPRAIKHEPQIAAVQRGR